MSELKWGYIGSGSIARSTANSITKGEHKITCVYSRNPETSKAFAEKYGAKSVCTLDELLSSDEVDAVYIATPHTSHIEYAIAALGKGKPVLCEKPVGINCKEVETMLERAKANNTYFAEAMWTWFSDVALKVKEWVNGGKIGQVKKVTIHYSFPGLLLPKTSRVRMPETAGGALLDIGIYPITYCYNLFGYPKDIRCKGKLKDGIDIAEIVTLVYDGFECVLKMSLYKLKEDCTIKGTDGKITLPIFHCARLATLKSKNGNETFMGKTDYLTEFSRCAEEIIAGKKESDYIPFSSTLDCMRIMDECRRQMGLVYPGENVRH